MNSTMPFSKETVLLTGASGSLGTYLMQRWSNLSSVHFTGRKTMEHPRYHSGDLSNFQFLKELLIRTEAKFVIHNAALTNIWGPWSDFESSNLRMMENVINAATELPGTRIVFISTPSVYHYSGRELVQEDFVPSRFPNHYAKSKYLAEQMLQSSGLPYMIFRPRAVLGKTDNTLLPRLLETYKAGKLKIVGEGRNKADFTAMANIEYALCLACQAETKAWNEVYNLTNGAPVEVYGMINELLNKLSLNPVKQKVPAWLAMAAGGFAEFVGKIRNVEPSISRYQMELLSLNYTLSIEKAREKLGYQPVQSNEDMLEELFQGYLSSNRHT